MTIKIFLTTSLVLHLGTLPGQAQGLMRPNVRTAPTSHPEVSILNSYSYVKFESCPTIGPLNTSCSGKYSARKARFGPKVIKDMIGRYQAVSPPDACEDITPTHTSVRKYVPYIAIVNRDNCSFEVKVFNAEKAGYRAVIIYGNKEDKDLLNMSSANPSLRITIPSYSVSHATGTMLAYSAKLVNTSRPSMLLIATRQKPFPPNFTGKMGAINANSGAEDEDGDNFGEHYFHICIYIWACVVVSSLIGLSVKWGCCGRSLTRWEVTKIPLKRFRRNSASDYQDKCPICHEEFHEGRLIRQLPCNHCYHSYCVDRWLVKMSNRCPLCKQRVSVSLFCWWSKQRDGQGGLQQSDADLDAEEASVVGELPPLPPVQSLTPSTLYGDVIMSGPSKFILMRPGRATRVIEVPKKDSTVQSPNNKQCVIHPAMDNSCPLQQLQQQQQQQQQHQHQTHAIVSTPPSGKQRSSSSNKTTTTTTAGGGGVCSGRVGGNDNYTNTVGGCGDSASCYNNTPPSSSPSSPPMCSSDVSHLRHLHSMDRRSHEEENEQQFNFAKDHMSASEDLDETVVDHHNPSPHHLHHLYHHLHHQHHDNTHLQSSTAYHKTSRSSSITSEHPLLTEEDRHGSIVSLHSISDCIVSEVGGGEERITQTLHYISADATTGGNINSTAGVRMSCHQPEFNRAMMSDSKTQQHVQGVSYSSANGAFLARTTATTASKMESSDSSDYGCNCGDSLEEESLQFHGRISGNNGKCNDDDNAADNVENRKSSKKKVALEVSVNLNPQLFHADVEQHYGRVALSEKKNSSLKGDNSDTFPSSVEYSRGVCTLNLFNDIDDATSTTSTACNTRVNTCKKCMMSAAKDSNNDDCGVCHCCHVKVSDEMSVHNIFPGDNSSHCKSYGNANIRDENRQCNNSGSKAYPEKVDNNSTSSALCGQAKQVGMRNWVGKDQQQNFFSKQPPSSHENNSTNAPPAKHSSKAESNSSSSSLWHVVATWDDSLRRGFGKTRNKRRRCSASSSTTTTAGKTVKTL